MTEIRENLDFSDALFLMRSKKKVARKSWNGKVTFLTLQSGRIIGTKIRKENAIRHFYWFYWRANQNDLLANDWYVVE